MNNRIEDKEIDKDFKMLCKISQLSAKKGYCNASNEYFSEYFKITTSTVSRKIKKLESKKYIKCEYEYRGFEIIKRKIYPIFSIDEKVNRPLTKKSTDHGQKSQPTIDEKVKDNNISNNTISVNSEKAKHTHKNSKELENEILKNFNELNEFIFKYNLFDLMMYNVWTYNPGELDIHKNNYLFVGKMTEVLAKVGKKTELKKIFEKWHNSKKVKNKTLGVKIPDEKKPELSEEAKRKNRERLQKLKVKTFS